MIVLPVVGKIAVYTLGEGIGCGFTLAKLNTREAFCSGCFVA